MAKDPVCGMDVDAKTAISLDAGEGTYYFCSEHCLKKFASQKNIPEEKMSGCCRIKKQPFYRNKTFIVSSALILMMLLSYYIPVLEPFKRSFLAYVKTIWWAVLLGLSLGGMIDHFVPREYISHILSKPKKRTIFYSVILGFFMSACSHGILALAIELHKKGASNPAVVAFLLASPWANMTVTIMLIGFFGLKAFYIILSAILIAVTTGLIFQLLERNNIIEINANSLQAKDDFSVMDDIKERIKKRRLSKAGIMTDIKGVLSGTAALGDMVLWWILIGMGIASFIGAYVPSGIFHEYMGPTLFGLIITLVLATVIEVCSEGSAPMAFEIFRQTGALGNAFVFLMAGVVTDYTEIGLLWHNVGKRTAILLPVITVPQVIALGIIANRIF